MRNGGSRTVAARLASTMDLPELVHLGARAASWRFLLGTAHLRLVARTACRRLLRTGKVSGFQDSLGLAHLAQPTLTLRQLLAGNSSLPVHYMASSAALSLLCLTQQTCPFCLQSFFPLNAGTYRLVLAGVSRNLRALDTTHSSLPTRAPGRGAVPVQPNVTRPANPAADRTRRDRGARHTPAPGTAILHPQLARSDATTPSRYSTHTATASPSSPDEMMPGDAPVPFLLHLLHLAQVPLADHVQQQHHHLTFWQPLRTLGRQELPLI